MFRLPVLASAIVSTCLLGIVLAAAACSTQSARQSAQNGSERTQTELPAGALTGSAEDYERAQFDDPTHIDNKWLPLKPGTQWVIKGSSIRGGGKREVREEHRIVETVTDLTKVVDGVRTVVMYDEDWHEGELLEPEVRFHAQDNAGNVWHFGQYREEYEDGKLVEPLGWVPGQKGARAGISMPAEPRLGTPSYAQGYAPPPVTWDDRARVYKMGQQTCVPVDCYEHVLVTEEFEPSIKGAFQLKYYAQGVGNVRIGWRGKKEEERETAVLVEVRQLSPEAMVKIREKAIELDRRGYEQPGKAGPYWKYTKQVYSHTQPVEHTLRVRR
jgi:hypothetical protein